MLAKAVGTGMLAGVAGVAAMTAAEKVEQALTHRPNSQVPGRTLARMIGVSAGPDTRRLTALNWTMHIGNGAVLGAQRGLMAFAGLRGPAASAAFTVVRLVNDQTLENLTGVGAPPLTWPRSELAVDVAHKTVYAFVTGAIADRVAGRAGLRPGEEHAAARPGRHADEGPVPRSRAYARGD